MADPVAAGLGVLSTILFLAIWTQITGIVPGAISPGINLISLIIALILGLVVYLSFSRF